MDTQEEVTKTTNRDDRRSLVERSQALQYVEPLRAIFSPQEEEEKTSADFKQWTGVIADELILAVYDEMRPRLFGYLRTMRLKHEEIEEIIQEAFVRLTIALQGSREIRNIRGWLGRVVHHLGLAALERDKRNAARLVDTRMDPIENVSDSRFTPEQTLLEQEQMERMTAALAAMKPLHRQCFSMRTNGLRYKDIGVALGISTQRAALIVKQAAVRLAAICE